MKTLIKYCKNVKNINNNINFVFKLVFNKNKNQSILKKVLFIIAIYSTIMLSCKKEITQKEYLTQQDWIQTKGCFESGGTTVYDYFAEMQACRKDDVIRFNSDGTYSLTEGASSCLTPRNETGKWELKSTEKVLFIYAPSDTISYNIDEISDNKGKFNSNELYGSVPVINRVEFDAK